MNSCPCISDLNVIVCRADSCGITGRFIASAPFIAGAVAILVSGAITYVTADRLLDRNQPAQADAADFADFIAEATGLGAALIIFIIGLLVVVSTDNLRAIVVLVGLILLMPFGWVVGRFVFQKDPVKSVRKKRSRALGWQSYTMVTANLVAILLVFFII